VLSSEEYPNIQVSQPRVQWIPMKGGGSHSGGMLMMREMVISKLQPYPIQLTN